MKDTRHHLLFLIPALLLTGCAGAGSDTKSGEDAASQDAAITGTLIENAKNYVTLGDYNHLTLERTIYVVTDDDVDAEIMGRLTEDVIWSEVTDEVESGDLLTLNLSWQAEDGTSGTEEDYEFELGLWDYGESFDDAFYGHRAGDTLQFSAAIDDSSEQALWAGKTVSFDAVITSVYRQEFPELTDDYVKEKGYDSVGAYEDAVRLDLENQYQSLSNEEVLDNALMEAMDQCIFSDTCPEQLSEAVADAIRTSHELEAQDFGMDLMEYYDLFGLSEEEIQAEVEEEIHTKLFISAVYEAEDLSLTQSEYQDYLSWLLGQENTPYAVEDAPVYETGADLEAAYGKETLVWSAYLWKLKQYLCDHAEVEDVIMDYTLEDLAVPEDPDMTEAVTLDGREDWYIDADILSEG